MPLITPLASDPPVAGSGESVRDASADAARLPAPPAVLRNGHAQPESLATSNQHPIATGGRAGGHITIDDEHPGGAGADAAQVGAAVAAAWRQIDATLTPVIGKMGVAALYRRSLSTCASAHPWIADANADTSPALDLPRLASVLAQRSGNDAVAAGCAMLQTFRALLASLIGPSLTERLLRSVWAVSSRAPSAKDNPP